jgi:hypothetical protein
MVDLRTPFSNLAHSIIAAERQSHAAIVVRLASVLDYDLERCIKCKFRPLNKKMINQLFGLYCPLSTFAAKIDIAFALDIISQDIHDELTKMRKIRNVFAHTRAAVSLDAEPAKSLFYKLKRPPGITGSYLEQFVKCGITLDDYLEAFLARMGVTEDLRLLNKTSSDK